MHTLASANHKISAFTSFWQVKEEIHLPSIVGFIQRWEGGALLPRKQVEKRGGCASTPCKKLSDFELAASGKSKRATPPPSSKACCSRVNRHSIQFGSVQAETR